MDDVIAGITVNTPICDGDNVNFIDNSIINSGSIVSWHWDFGDGNLSSLQNSSHTYVNRGVYTVTLSVTSNGGCTSSMAVPITINENPIAMSTPQDVCLHLPTIFTDQSTGNPTTWNWDFGDGNSSTQQNTMHTYLSSGSYNVTLTISTDSGCTSTLTDAVQVFDLPVAAFTSDVVCINDTMSFTNLSAIASGSITNWGWDFGDGNTSIQQNPTNIYSINSQTFDVQLTVTSDEGCMDTLNQQVSVLPVPSFDFWSVLPSGCEGDYIEFMDSSALSSGFITTYQWDFGDGNNSFLPNPSHQYNSAGNYFVGLTLTASDNCTSSDTLGFPVIIYPNPVAGFTPDPSQTSIYQPDILFMDESTGATNYDWNFGDSFGTSTFSSPVYTYQDTGFFTVTQIVISNYGCIDSTKKTVRINAEYTLFIPNAFIPYSNSENNTFFPKGMGVVSFKMLIFDRWGNKLFELYRNYLSMFF